MRTTTFWSKYLVGVLLLSTSPFILAADKELIEGEVTHSVEDHHDEERSRDVVHLKDKDSSKQRELKFSDGKISKSLLGIPAGTKIKVNGKKSDDHIDSDLLDSATSNELMEMITYPTSALKGAKKVLAVRVNFTDASPVCGDETSVYKAMFDLGQADSVKNYYRKNSKSLFDITGEVATVSIPVSAAQSTSCDYYGWKAKANEALVAAGYNLSSYNNQMFFLPSSVPCSWAGVGNVNGPSSWIKYCRMKTLVHELGHNFGLAHAASESGGTYGDYSDSMGGDYREFNAPHKRQLGWVPIEKVKDIPISTAVYRISPLNSDPSTSNYPHMLRIFKSDTNEYIYLSFRDQSGTFDSGLSSSYANRLNITRQSAASGYQMTYFVTGLGQGGSYSYQSSNISISNLAQTSEYIEISINGGVGTTDTTPPSVSLSSPANGSSFTEGSTVSASASASDNVGVSKVEFYVNNSLKCSDSTSPYSCSFMMPAGSNIPVKARAYDAAGNTKDSNISSISSIAVVDTTPPSVSLISPSNGSSFMEGSSVSASASASDNVGVTKVEFFVNNSLKCSDSTAPYSCSFSMPSGSNMPVKARAHDAAGNMKDSVIAYITSTPIVVDTTPPSVPQGLSLSTKKRSDVILSFQASTDNVQMSHYEILRNNVVIGTSISPGFTDSKVATGNYSYQVRAVDKASNKSALSSPATISIGGGGKSADGGGKGNGKGKNR